MRRRSEGWVLCLRQHSGGCHAVAVTLHGICCVQQLGQTHADGRGRPRTSAAAWLRPKRSRRSAACRLALETIQAQPEYPRLQCRTLSNRASGASAQERAAGVRTTGCRGERGAGSRKASTALRSFGHATVGPVRSEFRAVLCWLIAAAAKLLAGSSFGRSSPHSNSQRSESREAPKRQQRHSQHARLSSLS